MTTRMITCCPACSTFFKVGPEQLQIAGGWVRCGQCMAVFDAQERMSPADSYVPPDSDWPGQPEKSDKTPQPDLTEDVASSPSPVASDTRAMAPPEPESQSESPAADHPAPATPAFEPAPPPASEASQAAPAPIGQPPIDTTPPKAPATDSAHDKATAALLPILISDELDLRHARLLETLARLREDAEKHKNQPEEPNAAAPSDDELEQPAHKDRQDGPRFSWRDALWLVASHDASEDGKPAHEHKRGRHRWLRKKDQRTASDTQPSSYQESDEDPSPRPMIDFVLSEIGPSLPASTPSRAEAEAEPEAKPGMPSFIERAQRRAFWALPRVRIGLRVAAAVLILVLVAQVMNQRSRLAAQYPAMLPLLRTLCRPLQCQIGPWRHLSAAVIDSPAFVRLEPNSIRFEVTLRNSSAAPIITPSLELALIDAQDQPLVRRVLNPTDWGAPAQLTAHGQFNGAALLTVLDTLDAPDVSDCHYLLTAFYP